MALTVSAFAAITDWADALESRAPAVFDIIRGSPDDLPPDPLSVEVPLFPFDDDAETGAMLAVGFAALTAVWAGVAWYCGGSKVLTVEIDVIFILR